MSKYWGVESALVWSLGPPVQCAVWCVVWTRRKVDYPVQWWSWFHCPPGANVCPGHAPLSLSPLACTPMPRPRRSQVGWSWSWSWSSWLVSSHLLEGFLGLFWRWSVVIVMATMNRIAGQFLVKLSLDFTGFILVNSPFISCICKLVITLFRCSLMAEIHI